MVPMLTARQLLGEEGERIAEEWLTNRGWTILDRRFRAGHRDLDLVTARYHPTGRRGVAFVEVKTRRSALFGHPIEVVSTFKQREVAHCARAWIARNRRAGDAYRFDVIGVLLTDYRREVVHLENAFQLHCRS